MYTYTHSFLYFLPNQVITEYSVECYTVSSHLLSIFIHSVNSVYMSIPISQFTLPLPLLVTIDLFSTSVILFTKCPTFFMLYFLYLSTATLILSGIKDQLSHIGTKSSYLWPCLLGLQYLTSLSQCSVSVQLSVCAH